MCKTDQRVSEYEDGPDSEMIAGKSDAGESAARVSGCIRRPKAWNGSLAYVTGKSDGTL